MRRMGSGRGGFTLVELLAVVAVLAILAGLVMAATGAVRSSAARTNAMATVHGLHTAFQAYKTEFGQWPMTINSADILDNETPGSSTAALQYTTTNANGVLNRLEKYKLFAFDHEFLDSTTDGYLIDQWGYRYQIKNDSTPPTGWPVLDFYIYSTGGASGTGTSGAKVKDYIYKKE